MMLRYTAMTACLALVAPVSVLAQSASGDGEVNLESVDTLLGGSVVTEPEDDQGDAAEEAAIADGDNDGPAADTATDDTDAAPEDADDAGEGEEEPEVSDLTLAFNAYSLCASEAGEALEAEGFAVDQIGQEALLRCGGQRAAYVNAFYFSLLPRYPDTTEGDVREAAERLVTQSDAALINIVTAEARALRNARPEEPDAEPAEDADASE